MSDNVLKIGAKYRVPPYTHEILKLRSTLRDIHLTSVNKLVGLEDKLRVGIYLNISLTLRQCPL